MSNHKARLQQLEKQTGKRTRLLVPHGEAYPQRGEMTETEKQTVIENNPDKEVIFLHVLYQDKPITNPGD